MFEAEDGVPTEESYSGEWERRLMDDMKERRNAESITDSCSDSDSDSESQTSAASDLNYIDVQKMLRDMKHFALQKDDRFLAPVQGLLDLTDKCLLQSQFAKKQTTIENFFKPS